MIVKGWGVPMPLLVMCNGGQVTYWQSRCCNLLVFWGIPVLWLDLYC